MQIYVSIGDFSPALRSLKPLFAGMKQTGVDGVELVVGLKSRWSFDSCQRLAEIYDTPIVSLHQPLWAAMGVAFDEGFFALARRLQVARITCHPLPRVAFDDPRMQTYLRRLSAMQDASGIPVLLENLPEQYNHKLLHRLFPPEGATNDFGQVVAAARAHNLGVTMDVDHLQLAAPHEAPWFAELLPSVGNVHLSSFAAGKRHLPPYMGNVRTQAFLQQLATCGYKGPITLEVNYPRAIRAFSYDFSAIQRSVAAVREAAT